MIRDFLWLQLRDLPYFRALLRAVEARFYQDLVLPSPVLDLGCGDGHFATIAFERPLDVGLDPWWKPLRQTARRGGYRITVHGFGDRMPFSDGYFSSCISNSVLEHIPDVEAVLYEVARVLKPGSPFVFCVPNHQFLQTLSVSRFFDRLGLRMLAEAYRRFFNRVSRHYHCDSPEVWSERLQRSGFTIQCWWHYFSPSALHTLEWGHYFGLPSLVSRFLFGKWVIAPWRWNLFLTEQIVRRYYEETAEQPLGTYTFYIARRM